MTTDFIVRVNVRTTTTTMKRFFFFFFILRRMGKDKALASQVMPLPRALKEPKQPRRNEERSGTQPEERDSRGGDDLPTDRLVELGIDENLQ